MKMINTKKYLNPQGLAKRELRKGFRNATGIRPYRKPRNPFVIRKLTWQKAINIVLRAFGFTWKR